MIKCKVPSKTFRIYTIAHTGKHCWDVQICLQDDKYGKRRTPMQQIQLLYNTHLWGNSKIMFVWKVITMVYKIIQGFLILQYYFIVVHSSK